MKKILRTLMLAALMLPFVSQAQVNTYLFSTGVDNTRWYALTSDSTTLKVGSGNDSYATPVTNIGFTFNLGGTNYTQFSANSDGTVRLGSTVVGTGAYSTPFSSTNANTNSPKICGLGCDGYLLAANDTTYADYIAYQLFGTEGNRVLVIEISTGTYTTATRGMHYKFQIQLAEADNSVTIVYSPTAPWTAPAVAHQIGVGTGANDFVLFDNVNHTMTTYTAGTTTTNASGTWPDAGRYYTITPDPNACFAVSALQANNITANSMTLSWNDNTNTGATYTVYNMSDTSILATGLTTTTFTVANLTPSTSHTFGVEANCSATNASVITTVSAYTSCVPVELPFTEDFSASLSTSPCWRGATGTTADEVFNGAALTLGANSNWTYSSSTSNGIAAGHYRVNIYGSSCKRWMITPAIDLSNATSAQLSFDVAFTAYSGTSAASGFENNASQAFMVIVSTDGGNTWDSTNATKWQNAGGNYTLASIASTSYVNQVINLNQYIGDTIKIAFYAQSTTSGGDNNLHIDNIAVTEAPGCPNVMGLALDSSDATSANVSWNDNGADSYEVDVLQNGTSLTTVTVVVTDTTAAISGLVLDNDYQVVVRAVCGSDYGQWTSPLNVHIGYCLPTPSSVDNNGITSVSFGGMTNTTSHAGSTAAYVNNSTMAGSVPAGTTASVDITYATGYTYGTIIWVDWNNNMTFEGSEVVYAGESTNSNPTTLTATFDIPATQATGNYRMRILGADSYFDSYTGSLADAASANPCASYSWGVAEDYTLTVADVPSCMAVTNLTVDSVSATSVSLSWSDNDNTGATYTIYSSMGSVVASGITTTNYTVTGLTASTSYTFGVVANCSATDASDVATISATTDCAGGSCVITIAAQDGYGDGWDNSTITISQNGATVATYNMAGQGVYNTTIYDTFQVSVCSGLPVTFSWTSGSSYDDEAGFQIIDGGNAVVYTLSDASTLTDGAVFYTLNDACPSCATPAVTVDAATETSITISWTGNAASYDVYNGTTFVASVTANTYTFTGLTVATTYTFGVQAICSATDSSSMATITVMTSCADITTLPYFEGFENGLGCWNTVNGSADGQPWMVFNCAGLTGVTPHGGNYVASSWSWNSSSMHANAWLISPKFVLPNVSAGDSIIFTWYEITNPNYADHYSVLLSTTTDDTLAFTTVVRAYDTAAGSWTMQSIDLTAYAGQNVYLAFHHQDYDENYLLIDDISLTIGAAPVIRDSMQVTIAVNDPSMGTTNPAPGIHYFYEGDTASVVAIPNAGYHLEGWTINVSYAGLGVIMDTTVNIAETNVFDLFGGWEVEAGDNAYTWSVTANFATGNPPETHDSLTVITAVNNANWGTAYPEVGTHYYVSGENVLIGAVPADGYYISVVYQSVTIPGYGEFVDTMYAADLEIEPGEALLDTLEVDDDYMGVVMDFKFIFAPIGQTETYTVTIAVNDPTMGTTTPAPGEYTYEAGETVTVSAAPYDGYRFSRWSNGSTESTTTVTVTEDITLIAYFEPVQGIEDVEGLNVNVYSKENNVVVCGAEGYNVTVYDINGRAMANTPNAVGTVSFRMPATGVYIVKIGNTITKRVVVLR